MTHKPQTPNTIKSSLCTRVDVKATQSYTNTRLVTGLQKKKVTLFRQGKRSYHLSSAMYGLSK